VTSFALWLVGLGGRATGLALSTLSVVILARALGPVGRGQYFLFVSLVLVLTALADLGVSQSAVVFSGKGDVPLARLHRVVLSLATATSLSIGVMALVALPAFEHNLLAGLPAGWSFFALALVPASIYANYWTGLMVGSRRLIAVNVVQLGMNVTSVAANAAFVATTGNLAVAVLIYGAVLALQAVVMFIVAAGRTTHSYDLLDSSTHLARDMVEFGLRGYPGSLSTLVWSRAGVFALNSFHGPAAVGIYSVAQQLAERCLIPIQAMQDLMYARMARFRRDEATATLNRFLRVTITAVIPTAVVLLLASPLIVDVLFTESFSRSVAPLRILLAGSAVQSVPMLLAPFFLAQLRRPGLLSALGWVNAGLNIVLVTALVPGSAEVGAAAALVATQVIGTVIVFVIYIRMAGSDPASALVIQSADVSLVKQQVLHLIRR
jgi:O-antigen/teichoic acid export membrane protein